jgi:hypothetical protein
MNGCVETSRCRSAPRPASTWANRQLGKQAAGQTGSGANRQLSKPAQRQGRCKPPNAQRPTPNAQRPTANGRTGDQGQTAITQSGIKWRPSPAAARDRALSPREGRVATWARRALGLVASVSYRDGPALDFLHGLVPRSAWRLRACLAPGRSWTRCQQCAIRAHRGRAHRGARTEAGPASGRPRNRSPTGGTSVRQSLLGPGCLRSSPRRDHALPCAPARALAGRFRPVGGTACIDRRGEVRRYRGPGR